MEEQLTLSFTDVDDGSETVVMVRAVADGVGLTLSKRVGGDLEVFMPSGVAAELVDALREVTR
jgi:hypothetical protein